MSHKAVSLTVLVLLCCAPQSFGQSSSNSKSQLELHSKLAQQYLEQRRPDLAIPEFEKVVALDPSNVEARGNLGVLLFFSGDYKGAVPQLRAAVKLKQGLWKLQGLLGLAEDQLNDMEAGRADLAAAFPNLTEEKFQLQVGNALIENYTATEDLDKAASVVSDLLATRPTDTTLLYLSYRLYSDLAGRAMLTLALSDPNSAEMHQVMARELARHGDDAAAIENYREALKLNPQLPGLHTELGDLLYHSPDQKLQATAQSEFEAALAVNPRDERAEISLGIIAAKNADLQTALTDDSRAVELNPNDSDACVELARVLELTNKNDQARELLERAIKIDPTNYVAHYRLATLYRKEGKPDAAKQQVAEYLKYKQMKDKLEKIFEDMRVASGQHANDDDADPSKSPTGR